MKLKLSILICMLLFSSVATAFELFGVDVAKASREDLRAAIRNSGMVVEREAGENNWFDIYDASPVFSQSRKLFVSYDKRSGKFAFAEYQLPYSYMKKMRARLTIKYGQPEKKAAGFESDSSYHWEVDGIQVSLKPLWQQNRLQLLYINPQSMPALIEDYQAFRKSELGRVLKVEEPYF